MTHEGAKECVVCAHNKTFPGDEYTGYDDPVDGLHPDHDIDAVDEGVSLNVKHVEDKAVGNGAQQSKEGVQTPHCSSWVLSIPPDRSFFSFIFCCKCWED